MGRVFSHVYYIPIVLSALWWKRRGLWVVIFLAIVLILSHFFIREFVETYYDFVRVFMFLFIGLVVTFLSEGIELINKKTIQINAILRTIRSINQIITRESDRDIFL